MTITPKIIALEGVGGSGKSSLAAPLAKALNATLIKRPLTTPPDMSPDALRWWMLDDARDCLDLARKATTPYVILDRHWLSAAIYQDAPSFPRPLRHYAAALGEPDLWVILSAPASEIIRRLRDRSADGRRHLDSPARIDLIGARIVLYDEARHHLRAPVIEVRWLPPQQPASYARLEVRSPVGDGWMEPLSPDALADYLKETILATLEGRS